MEGFEPIAVGIDDTGGETVFTIISARIPGLPLSRPPAASAA